MKNTSINKYLLAALVIGLLFHGIAIFYTLESSYDALIHLFFGNHYANSWFEPWNQSWYTGFTVMGYPPLVHQSIGLLSFIGGLKFGMYVVSFIAIVLFISGMYRFALMISSNPKVAGYTALFSVFSSSFIETLHIFGQLPSIIGLSILLHALPEIYNWLRSGRYTDLLKSLSLMAVAVTSHHVTPIFGMVFFIFPLIGLVIMDVSSESIGSYKAIRFVHFIKSFKSLFKRILLFGFGSLVLIIACILPYWINTKNNPITQVPIPHGSRDNFFEVSSSGFIFFIIPWGILLIIMPYIWYRFFSKRYLFFGISITLLAVLGTGGTTPIPKMLLGENAYNILTLDRFTLWASIMALPIFGEFGYRFIEGDLKHKIKEVFSELTHSLLAGFLIAILIGSTLFTISLGSFRPSQPQKIKMLPIINFLNQDQHDHWRFLPLGFGDQMAWLSAQTKAMTVDGNYHSARRLPELTSRAVERLENSKFRGIEGIGSLQQFLTVPEKYHLKYVFSNDKFYDPILYFCGWQRLRRLENGIMVWEKLNIPPLPSILFKEDVPKYQKVMWGLIPIGTVIFVFFIYALLLPKQLIDSKNYIKFEANKFLEFKNTIFKASSIWGLFMLFCATFGVYHLYIKNNKHHSPSQLVKAYYNALDFKEFENAYSFLDPMSSKTKDQFMLEIAVTDGLLGSYAKLEHIEVEIKDKSDSTAKAKVYTNWITPLEKIERINELELSKRKNKWYLKPRAYDLDIPPDQFFATKAPLFYNHGRRRINSEQTYHEDVLKQPVLEVLSSKIVKNNDAYSLIGEIQNIDNVPADVVVSGSLFNANNEELARFNAKHQIKHKLMPKEVTSFRINFEGIAWVHNNKPKTFDPDEFTAIDLLETPKLFNLQCAANVTTADLYKEVSVATKVINNTFLEGTLFNSGLENVTIPMLLISYYNKEQELVWVDHQYCIEEVRPQRRQYFKYKLLDLSNRVSMNDDMSNVYVNGLANEEISSNVVPDRKVIDKTLKWLPVNGKGYGYIKIEVINFIGSSN